jgi:hypothetical protein
MARLSHEKKVKMARKMLTNQEKSLHVPMFQSAAWDARRTGIEIRIQRNIEKKFIEEAREVLGV